MEPPVESPNTRLASAEHAARRVLEHVTNKQAMSALRIGDGEGVVLSRPDLLDFSLSAYLTSHFGVQCTQKQLDDLATRLTLAIGRAKVIGIRPDTSASAFPASILSLPAQQRVTWARDNLSLRPEESASLDPESAHRLILLGRWMADFDWPKHTLLTSAWVHFDWLESGFLADLVMSQGHIGLVTGRQGLSPILREAGIKVDQWTVPLRYLRREAAWTPHFPHRFDELLDTLAPAFPGQLFLVGAGICGKVYCDVIAQRGGIAIDVGAVCDAWLGIATRPRVSLDRWGQESVPHSLLLEHQLAARSRQSGVETTR